MRQAIELISGPIRAQMFSIDSWFFFSLKLKPALMRELDDNISYRGARAMSNFDIRRICNPWKKQETGVELYRCIVKPFPSGHPRVTKLRNLLSR